MNAPIDIDVHIWAPEGCKSIRKGDVAALPEKLRALFPELNFRKSTASIEQEIFFERVVFFCLKNEFSASK